MTEDPGDFARELFTDRTEHDTAPQPEPRDDDVEARSFLHSLFQTDTDTHR